MKKIIYIALLTFAASLAFTSCTEDEVTPSSEYNGGGGPSPDPLGGGK